MANIAEADHRTAGIAERLTDLVNSQLLGRRINLVAFADAFLALAYEASWMRVRPESHDALAFSFRDSPPVVLRVDAAVSKLRSLCARVAKLCEDTTNAQFQPYGGEGSIMMADGADRKRWYATWANTAYIQELFLIRWELTPWGKI